VVTEQSTLVTSVYRFHADRDPQLERHQTGVAAARKLHSEIRRLGELHTFTDRR